MAEEKKSVGNSGFEKEKERNIIRMVEERMPGVIIKTIKMDKNNGYEKEGFLLRAKESFTGIAVYREDMEAACGENCTVEEAADHICSVAERELRTVPDMEDISDWEKARHMVYRKIVNYEKNSCRLPDLVHRRFLDLAEVYYLKIRIPEKGWGVTEVTVQLQEEWGIPEEELSGWADANMDADGYHMVPMRTVLQEILPSGEPDIPEPGLYVILNGSGELGAGIMTRPEYMRDFMQQIGTDGYILPSSIHELLVCPCGKDVEEENLKQIIMEVNQTAVSPEEFLSDSVYFCHMDTGEVELCCSE